jgi:hypothetical protein
MSAAVDRYEYAGGALDDHVAQCGACPRCEDGDAIAEEEFRAWRELQRSDPDAASKHQARKGLAW